MNVKQRESGETTRQFDVVQKCIAAYDSAESVVSLISLHFSSTKELLTTPKTLELQEVNQLITFAQKQITELNIQGKDTSRCQSWLNCISNTFERWEELDVKKHYFGSGRFMPDFERLRDSLGGKLPPILELVYWHQPRALHLNFGFENGCLPSLGAQTFNPLTIGARSPNWGEPPRGAWFTLSSFDEDLISYKLNLLILIIAKELHLSIGRVLSGSGVYVVYKSTLIIDSYKSNNGTDRYYFGVEQYDDLSVYQHYIDTFLPMMKK